MNLLLLYYYAVYSVRVRFPELGKKLRIGYVKREFIDDRDELGKIIKEKIASNEPFMACRIGATESFSMRTFEFHHKKNFKKAIRQLHETAGFFPEDVKFGKEFTGIMKSSLEEADVCGILRSPAEEFFINKFTRDSCKITTLYKIEPFLMKSPWSAMLYGKKVLVVHPFAKTIESQYKKRPLLFPGKDILPEFQLLTYKAIQTAAGEKDERFETWFDALEFMTKEISRIDFDIALLGCGAYGCPLAANIKRMGKQAIHIGGGLQLLFGIRGRRWDVMSAISALYNDSWVYPSESERPKGADIVENACYWK